ncbi:MAG: hypothetical protein B7C24_12395 [Bacteroidetes bacterium 4572_77]|nr:MAG: hypothetical protein B7C24_12395 [Bacteroidetes bacterium 4572_77]
MKELNAKELIQMSQLKTSDSFTDDLMQIAFSEKQEIKRFKRVIVILSLSVAVLFPLAMLLLANVNLNIVYWDIPIPAYLLQLLSVGLFFLAVNQIYELSKNLRILLKTQKRDTKLSF